MNHFESFPEHDENETQVLYLMLYDGPLIEVTDRSHHIINKAKEGHATIFWQ